MTPFNPHTAANLATALEEATGAHHEPWPDDGDGGYQCGGCQRDMHLSSSELEPRGLCDRCIDQAISDASAAAAQLRAAIGEVERLTKLVAMYAPECATKESSRG